MRVFVFGIRGFPLIGGGAEVHSEELYPRLDYDITVLARTVYFDTWKGVKFKKIPYIHHPYLETVSHSILCSLYCIKKRPDIVHIHNMVACIMMPLLFICGIKVVYTMHSFNYLHKKWNFISRFFLNVLEGFGINFSYKTITVSEDMRNALCKKYDRSSIDYISNAVKKPEFVRAGMTLKKYGLEPKKYILGVGRLVPEKGFDKLIEAYKLLNPKYKLVIVGNGDTAYAKDLLRLKNDKIIFTGYQCGVELAELYTNTGLFVISSFNEGQPLVLLEALSYGVPILASNIEANKYIRLPSYRYYQVDDVEELQVKIQGTFNIDFTDKQKYAFKHMLQNEYDWDKIAKKVKEIYESICHNSSSQ